MTVASYAAQPPRVEYIDDGVTTLRDIPFKFFDPDELTVIRYAEGAAPSEVEPLILNIHYTVAGGAVAGICATGSITLISGGTDGETLRIDRNTKLQQSIVWDPADDFPARSMQESADRQVMMIQELRRDTLTVRDVFDIIVDVLGTVGEGLTVIINDDDMTITLGIDVEWLEDHVAGMMREGGGMSIVYDDVLGRITYSAASLEDIPDCVMLSGDQQNYDGAFGTGGGGSGLTTEDVQDIIGSVILGTAPITATYDDGAGTVTIATTAGAGLTDENVRDLIGDTLQNGTLIGVVVDDAGDHVTINSTALDPAYAGVVPADHAGAFDFSAAMNGEATNWTGGAASITIRDEADVPLPDGWAHVVRNTGAAPITIHRDTAVSLKVNGGGVSADATIAIDGVATINRWGADDFTIVGPGVS